MHFIQVKIYARIFTVANMSFKQSRLNFYTSNTKVMVKKSRQTHECSILHAVIPVNCNNRHAAFMWRSSSVLTTYDTFVKKAFINYV